jgi:hypothetical protein
MEQPLWKFASPHHSQEVRVSDCQGGGVWLQLERGDSGVEDT